ncbi:alpha-L-arabinofuranosidase C-terminal domain-containing protein, partial [Nonomuraea helvata]
GVPTRETLQTVSVSASRKDGRVLVSLSNLDAAEPIDVDLDLRGGAVADVRARILTADKPQTHNTPEAPDAVAPRSHQQVTPTASGLRVHLPAHSFVTVEGRLA